MDSDRDVEKAQSRGSDSIRNVWLIWSCGLVLAFHTCIVTFNAYRNSPTVDETGNVVAGVSYWRFGDFSLYCVNPPLSKLCASAPVMMMDVTEDWTSWHRWVGLRTEGRVGRDFVRANADRIRQIFFWARLAMIPFSWIGALACYWLAKRFYGQRCGAVALTLWCISPTVLAHAGLVTADVPAAAAAVVFLCFLDRVWERPSTQTGLALGVALGIAALTKFSLIVLLPAIVVPLVASYTRFVVAKDKSPLRRALLISLPMALYVLNLGYLGVGTFTAIGDYHFVSHAMQSLQSTLPNRLPIPLPSSVVEGIDAQARDFQLGWPSFLMGHIRRGGFPSYFLWATLFKVPAGTLVVLGLGVFARKLSIREVPLLLVPVLLILAASKPPSIHIGIRYILPALPLLFVLASRTFERPGWIRRIGTLSCFATSVAVLLATPHFLGFFSLPSRLFGSPHHLLADSNIDWGQDLYALADWKSRNAPNSVMHIAYFGQVDPRCVGLAGDLPPLEIVQSEDAGFASEPTKLISLKPGLYAISINFLTVFDPADWGDAVGFSPCRYPRLGYFDKLQPIAEVGTSIRIYQLSSNDCRQLNPRLRFEKLRTDSQKHMAASVE
ncbi:glycosyltransferase family 39 protein [Rubripirellula amarantea]|nr:glycosyltransferase family 39 protein [Rubripirellula amarantea]